MNIVVSAFYKFVAIDDAQVLRASLLSALTAGSLKGTILLAHEGINGTISGAPAAMTAFMASLRADPRFVDLVTKDAVTNAHPFRRLKVKVKREIISFGLPEADPTLRAGIRVAPSDWNALLAQHDVLLLDARNDYEVAVGTFAGAVDPMTRSFGEFPAFVAKSLDPARHRKIAMFCTGGIRCEKASAHLKGLGFANVYQLEGGILNYLATVSPAQNLWRGACYVFDERETVAAMKAET